MARFAHMVLCFACVVGFGLAGGVCWQCGSAAGESGLGPLITMGAGLLGLCGGAGVGALVYRKLLAPLVKGPSTF